MGEKSHYFTFDQIKLLLSKVEIIGVWKNSSRDPKMRFLARCFVGKQWNLFMSLWVHFLFQFKLMMTWAQLLLFLFYSAICHHCDKFLPGEESLGAKHISQYVSPWKYFKLQKYFADHQLVRRVGCLTCMMKAGGEEVGSGCCCITRGLTTPPLRLLRTGMPELWLHRGAAVVIPAMADIP